MYSNSTSVARRQTRRRALTTVSLAGVVTAFAISESTAQQTAAAAVEEIVVTGTRIIRDGFEAPTPLTVMNIEEIQAALPENLADFVNEMPTLSGSTVPRASQTSISSGGAGVNSLDLRGIGNDRTLVLLDGQRSVAAQLNGVVDVNNFPQNLVQRVDIVTGGASAAYGSDAVAGVVNFVLDKQFTGIKGSLEGGATTYGDGRSVKFSTAYGAPFAQGRGHFLFSGEIAHRAGILHGNRDWNRTGWAIMNNPAYTPTNGQPEHLRLPNVGLSTAIPGGIITNTALRGTAFGTGGVARQYNYGTLVRDPWMYGGEWQTSEIRQFVPLDPRVNRQSVFTRLSYNLSDNVEVFAQAQFGQASVLNICCNQFSVGNIRILIDNPFIPEEVAARGRAAGVTAFNLGSFHADLPRLGSYNVRITNRYVVGATGSFDAFDSSWNWDAYYQSGRTRVSSRATNVWSRENFNQAVDAVRDPATGNIVCRSTLTEPNNGCVPYNPMGIGVNEPAALTWLGQGQRDVMNGGTLDDMKIGGAWRNERFIQNVGALSVGGTPFDSWAGPVSLAFGGEWRREKVWGVADPISGTTLWFAGNYLPTNGSYTVVEGFVETVVPLAEGLDLNAAVRVTDYSTSGVVTTWKVGATWSPIPDVTFRATRSRDIRAANLEELFQAGTANTNNVVDPANNNQTTQYLAVRTGNQNLRPEKADTTGIGLVLQPSFLAGFSASTDYYNIEIVDAIDQVGPQTIVDRCFEGQTEYCAAITRGDLGTGVQVITRIDIAPFNFARNIARGLDVEVGYQMPVADLFDGAGGDLSVRFLATHYIKNFEDNGIDPAQDHAGENAGDGPPNWLYRLSASYSNDLINLTFVGRGISSGVIDNDRVECTSGCPTSTSTNRTINDNQVEGRFYIDLNAGYKIQTMEEDGRDIEAFFNIKNLLDKDPPMVPGGPGGVPYLGNLTNSGLYDTIGRTIRAGLRFTM